MAPNLYLSSLLASAPEAHVQPPADGAAQPPAWPSLRLPVSRTPLRPPLLLPLEAQLSPQTEQHYLGTSCVPGIVLGARTPTNMSQARQAHGEVNDLQNGCQVPQKKHTKRLRDRVSVTEEWEEPWEATLSGPSRGQGRGSSTGARSVEGVQRLAYVSSPRPLAQILVSTSLHFCFHLQPCLPESSHANPAHTLLPNSSS